MEIKKITREDEAALPRFRTHREARLWFTIKYGDAFQLEESFAVGEHEGATICYRYALVLDREVYERGLRQLAQGSMGARSNEDTAPENVGADEFLRSYQSIEVMLDGSVHVIH